MWALTGTLHARPLPNLTIEQQAQILFDKHEAPLRLDKSRVYALKDASRWVGKGRKFEDFPLLRHVRQS